MPAPSLARELQSVRVAFRQLDRSFARFVTALAAGQGASAAPVVRRKLKLSPARKAALKLQGQYVGHMRGLAPAQKAKVKRVREAKGIRAAIAAAKRLSG